MFENIDIEKVKEELKNLSKNYKENFAKIEKFIENEIQEILNLKKNKGNRRYKKKRLCNNPRCF